MKGIAIPMNVNNSNINNNNNNNNHLYIDSLNSSSHGGSPRSSQRRAHLTESEIDPLSIIVVDELLSGINEWRPIGDIVRTTFKALAEVVKNQGELLRDLERQNISNVKLGNLKEYLDTKASTTDVRQSLNELVSIVSQKPSFDDISTKLSKYCLKEEVVYHLDSKLSIEDAQSLLESRVPLDRFSGELDRVFARMEESVEDMKRMRAKAEADLININAQLNLKPTIEEINILLETKANKQSVVAALQRKANKVDLETLLTRKADTNDVQNLLSLVNQKADFSSLDTMAAIIDAKVDKSELTHFLQSLSAKADRTDIDILQSQLQQGSNDLESFKALYERELMQSRTQIEDVRFQSTQLANKRVEQKDFDKLYQIVLAKVDSETFSQCSHHLRDEMVRDIQDLKEQIIQHRKVSDDSLNQRFKKSENLLETLREGLIKSNESLKSVSEERRNEIEEHSKFTKNILTTFKKESTKEYQSIIDDLHSVKTAIYSQLTFKLDKTEFVDFNAKIYASLEEKTDLQEVQNALNACQSDASSRYLELKEEVKSNFSHYEAHVHSALDKKANTHDVHLALASKVDHINFTNNLQAKVSISEFEELKKLVERTNVKCDEKASAKEFDSFTLQTTSALDEMQREVYLKANQKDVSSYLDQKSNIEDVNRALSEMHREVEKRSFQDDLNNIVNDQAMINEQLCTENIVARWNWKSGETKTGSLVPWETQLVNTLPDNFLWEKEKTSILVVAPGLYEVSFGFFSKKKPFVQLLVNGEVILSSPNNNSSNTTSNSMNFNSTATSAFHHAGTSKNNKDIIKHSNASNNSTVTTGITLVDFILIPARARVSLSYVGEFGAEAFFGIKRL